MRMLLNCPDAVPEPVNGGPVVFVAWLPAAMYSVHALQVVCWTRYFTVLDI